MLEIINSPWKDKFFSYVEKSNCEIKICSPFVKKDIVNEIYIRKHSRVNLNLVTNFNIANFYRGASDIEAMERILDNGDKIRNFQNLHAKIYLFDSRLAVVTSANLTTPGLTKNYEYGVVCDEYDFVSKVNKDFENVLTSDLTGKIGRSNIQQIRKIISDLPQDKVVKFPKINLYENEKQNIDELLVAETGAIESNLRGWKLQVFKQLNNINKQVFDLHDVYSFADEFRKIYPNNREIEAKIRQQLQFLRDLGLIKFMGGGRYKKLWL